MPGTADVMQELFIIGSGGHARVVLDIARAAEGFLVLGFFDDNRKKGLLIDGVAVLGNTSQIAAHLELHPRAGFVVAVGDNYARSRIVAKVENLYPAVRWQPLVDPSANISPGASIGEGAMVLPGAVCNTGVKIGRHVILNNSSSIAHDSVFEDCSSTGPGAVTGGGVRVGAMSHIGIGAAISHGVAIGAHSVIGAGSVVIKHCPDQVVMFGVPGEVIRKRAIGESYL